MPTKQTAGLSVCCPVAVAMETHAYCLYDLTLFKIIIGLEYAFRLIDDCLDNVTVYTFAARTYCLPYTTGR